MTDQRPNPPSLRTSIVTLVAVLVAMFAAFLIGRTQAGRSYGRIQSSVAKGQLVAEIQAQLVTAAEAEKSAVMADTDEASHAYAADSRTASDAVEAARTELGSLLASAARADEQKSFRDFSECWTTLREADREILDLAVQNSNLKAQRLSFGPAPAALARMQAALDAVVAGGASAPVVAAAYQTMTAALKIHGLEGRHIAEPGDAEMDAMEVEMRSFDAQVNAGLDALSSAAGDTQRESIATARTAYADFQKLHAELLVLSRRNSNVRSLALSLGQKRKITAQCLDHLNALEQAVRPIFEATR